MTKKNIHNDDFDEFKSLSTELSKYLSDNEELVKQMGLQEDIARKLINIQKAKGKATESELEDLKSFSSQLKRQLEYQTEINEKIAELKKDNIFNKWGKKIKATGIHVKALLSDWRIAGALLTTSLASHLSDFAKEWEGARKELGMTGDQALDLGKNLGGASLQGIALGISLSDSREAATALVNEANTLRLSTTKNIKEVARLSSWYGVSAESGAKLVELSHLTEMNTIKFAESLATANGVAPGKVMKGIAENSEMFAGRTKESTKNLIQATINANKLGVEMADLKSVSSSLLDIETSMANEQELSVLAGKNINLGRAREFAFQRKEKEMLNEILNQMGSYQNFLELNPLAQQKMADTLGISLESLSSMLKNQEELNKQEHIHHGWLGRNWLAIQGIGKSAWEYKDTIGSTLLMLVNMKQLNVFSSMAKGIKWAISGIGELIKKIFKLNTAEKLSTTLTEEIGPKLPKGGLTPELPGKEINVNSVKENKGMSKGNPIVSWINSWGDMDKKALINFALAIGLLIITIPLLAIGLKQFNDVKWTSAIMGMGSLAAMVGIMKLIGNDTAGLVKGAAAMFILSAALIPLGFGLSMFTKNINGDALLTAGAALLVFTGMVFGLGALIAGPGAVLFSLGVIGFIALGGALMVLGAGLNSISNAMGSMKDNLGAIVPLVSELASITPQLFLIGLGFASMGAGLIGLAAGLAIIAPLVPILGAITSFTSNQSESKEEKTSFTSNQSESKEEKTSNSKNNDGLLSRIDKLIALLEAGGTVQMDGKAMGKWVAFKIDEMNVYPK